MTKLLFTVHVFHTKISKFTPFLYIRIVQNFFICLFAILRNSQLESDVCRLRFAVSVALNLFNVCKLPNFKPRGAWYESVYYGVINKKST